MEGTSGFCRACLIKFGDSNALIQYTEKNRRQFFYLTGIQVKQNDLFTFQLCKDCYQKMIISCKFKKLCRTSDKQFKQYSALNEAGGTRDFEEFLRTTENTFSYPLNNEISTPIYKPSQDGDNASTCPSFRSFMNDLMKGDELPDTAYKIIEEVVQEESDIMDDSIDSQWLQDDVGLPTDLNFDFSFSMFRSPYTTDSPQDNRFALTEYITPDHQYVPFIKPYTPKGDLNTVIKNSETNTSTVITEAETNKISQIKEVTCQKDSDSHYTTDLPQDNCFALTENKTPDQYYDPFIEPYTPNIDLYKVTQNSETNTSSVVTEKTNKTSQTNKISCQKDLTKVRKIGRLKNKIKSKVVKDAESINETLKVENNERLDNDRNTKQKNESKLSQVKRRKKQEKYTTKQESDVKPKKYNLRKVKPKSSYIKYIESLTKYLEVNFKRRYNPPSTTKRDIIKKRIKKNATVKDKFKGQIVSQNVNGDTKSDTFSLSEFNISENDTILKTDDVNIKDMMPLNQDLIKYTEPKINENLAVLTNTIDTKQYQDFFNIDTNQYNELENIPISYEHESSKQNYSILDIDTYQTDTVIDKIFGGVNEKTEQYYKIENIGNNIDIENNQNSDLSNIGINLDHTVHNIIDSNIETVHDIIDSNIETVHDIIDSNIETVHDIIDRNIEMALNQSNSDVVKLEDILNTSFDPFKSVEPDRKIDLPMKPDLKKYFESFIEEINTPLEIAKSQQPENGINIIENIKIKGPDEENLIEKFINDNKDTYSYSLEKLQHELVIEIVKMYDMVLRRCEMCNKNFNSERSLRLHLKLIHKFKVSPSKKVKKLHRNYICTVCAKPFQSRIKIETHIRSHELFECDICGLKMEGKGNMMKHKKLHKYHCSECNKQCSTELDYKLHTRAHTSEEVLECHICHQKFRRRDKLYKHVLMHDEKTSYDCPFCKKTFLKKSLVNLHLSRNKVCRKKNLMINGQKTENFDCPFCKKTFLKKYLVNQHVLINKVCREKNLMINGQKTENFDCPFCKKTFLKKYLVNQHVLINKVCREKNLMINGQKTENFDCPFCKKTFLKKYLVNQHVSRNKVCREQNLMINGQKTDNIKKKSKKKVKKPVSESRVPELETKRPEFDLRLPETELILSDAESKQPDNILDELYIPEIGIPAETPEEAFIPIKYVEDDIAINLFPQNNNYEKEYVINPSFF